MSPSFALGTDPAARSVTGFQHAEPNDVIRVAQFHHVPPPVATPPIAQPPQVFIPVTPPPAPKATSISPDSQPVKASLPQNPEESEPAAFDDAAERKTIVRDLQKLLTDLGYEPGPIDGLVGGRTINAVLALIEGIGQEDLRKQAQAAIDSEDYRTLVQLVRGLTQEPVGVAGAQHSAPAPASFMPPAVNLQQRQQEEFDEITQEQLAATWEEIAGYNIERSKDGLRFMDRLKEKAVAEVRDIANSLFGFDDEEDGYIEVSDNSDAFDTNVLDNTYTVSGFKLGGPVTYLYDSRYFTFAGPTYTKDTLPEALKEFVADIPGAEHTLVVYVDARKSLSIVDVAEVAPGVYEQLWDTGFSEIHTDIYSAADIVGARSEWVRIETGHSAEEMLGDSDENRWRYIGGSDAKFVDVDLGGATFATDAGMRTVERLDKTIQLPGNSGTGIGPESVSSGKPLSTQADRPVETPPGTEQRPAQIGMNGPVQREETVSPEPLPETPVLEPPSAIEVMQVLQTYDEKQWIETLGDRPLTEQERLARDATTFLVAGEGTPAFLGEDGRYHPVDNRTYLVRGTGGDLTYFTENDKKLLGWLGDTALYGTVTTVGVFFPPAGLALGGAATFIKTAKTTLDANGTVTEAVGRGVFDATVNVATTAAGGKILGWLKPKALEGGGKIAYDFVSVLIWDKTTAPLTNAVSSENIPDLVMEDYNSGGALIYYTYGDHGAWNAQP